MCSVSRSKRHGEGCYRNIHNCEPVYGVPLSHNNTIPLRAVLIFDGKTKLFDIADVV
jgi:hypothetical protein